MRPIKKTKVKVITNESSPVFEDMLQKEVEKIENNKGEIISISHGAGIGIGVGGQYGSTQRTRRIYSAVISYKIKVDPTEVRNESSSSGNPYF